ncbi:D123-domain-containing protein, partial [Meira miltonrushii]
TEASIALQHTRFANWFPSYRRYSPKATIIDLLHLQPDFLDWLEEDGLVLPSGSDNTAVNASSRATISEEDDISANGSTSSEEDDDEEEAVPRNFTALNERIRQIIDQYEGAVFPKLDWSAPLDAAWMVPGTSLRCTEPSDIYLLLKSSDFVNKDVSQLYELAQMAKEEQEDETRLALASSTVSPQLVLKKFFSIPTSHEFRCFVRCGQLICISQRDTGTFFDHLQPIDMQNTILDKLTHFFNTTLRSGSQSHASSGVPISPFPIKDFVWDAYLTRDLSRVLIIDINPYMPRTDALLWDWEEIEEEAKDVILAGESSTEQHRPSLRLVTSRAQTTQSFPTYAHNMMPSDVVGLAQGTDIAEFARQFNEQIAEAALDQTKEDQ